MSVGAMAWPGRFPTSLARRRRGREGRLISLGGIFTPEVKRSKRKGDFGARMRFHLHFYIFFSSMRMTTECLFLCRLLFPY